MAVARLAAMKEEPPDPGDHAHLADPVSLEERILTLCAANPKGISDDVIIHDQPTVSAQQRMKALQRLLSQGKVDLLKQGSTLVYRLKATSSTTSKTKGFEMEERLVYQIIEDSGNKGIWNRDIRFKSNLVQTKIMKILRTLESKKLVKSVQSVQAPKKRFFMLHDLAPDESLTGGAWYSDQDFESEFVEVLNQNCLKFLQQKAVKAELDHPRDPASRKSASFSSGKEVCKFITELGISKVPLSVGDIETILNTLLYDGRAEVTVVACPATAGQDGTMQRLYRAMPTLLQDTGFSRMPCGVCPVINQCCDGGAISPSSCAYLKDWLNF